MELSDRLMSLAKVLVEEINSLRASGGLVREEIPYVKYVVDFEYKNGVITSLSTNTEEITKGEYGRFNSNISDLSQRVIELIDMSEFSACLDDISECGGIDQFDAVPLLHQFIEYLATEVIEHTDTSDIHLSGLIAKFLDELSREPDWKITIWLSGVWVEHAQIELAEGVILRQPIASDFEDEVPLAWLPYHHRDVDKMSLMAVLEFTVRETSYYQASDEISNFENLLKLFRLGQISRLKHTASPSRLTGLTLGTSITSHGKVFPSYKYEFRQDDVDVFTRYHERVRPLLDELTEQDDYIGIAYHRYKAALSEGAESRIALAINCLEALYLGSGVEQELRHRLSQRVAALLRQKMSDRGTDIYQKVRDAYDIRSKFVHGAVGGRKGRQAAYDLSIPILEYARVSVLIFLQLRKVKSKDEFLKLIDRSLLDETDYKELIDLVMPVIVT